MIKSICIVRLSALGDVLMLVPLVRTLQTAFPHALITWVISRPAYDLVEGMDGIHFVVIDKPKRFMDYWRFKRLMRRQHFDVLLATQASFRANLLYACISASRKIGYDALRAKDAHGWFVNEKIQPGRDHTLDGFLRFADALGVVEKKICWDLPIPDVDFIWARAHYPAQARLVCLVNPAASKPERSWLVERYVAVIKHMQSRWQAQVILIGGPGETDRVLCDAIVQQVDVVNLAGQSKPKQLLALMSLADLVLCPDTGPSHMAAAVGTPVIALHAVTSADVSGPYPYRHFSVDCYPEAVVNILKKTSETNIWGSHAHGNDTMRLVSVDAVIAKIDCVFTTHTSSRE